MVEAVLASLVKAIMGNIDSLIVDQVGMAIFYKQELKKLMSTASTIQAVLRDSEQRQIRSEALEDWLAKLKDAAYDADDLLDEFATDSLLRTRKIQVCNCSLLPNPSIFHFKMGHRIKKIRDKLDSIADDRSKFHLKGNILGERNESSKRQQTYSFIDESQVYGREEDRSNILKQLMDDSHGENCSIFPIVGMGGIGKTTVTQLVYNDDSVKDHFGLRLWLCIPECFDEGRLMQIITEAVLGNDFCLPSLDEMIQKLKMMMHNKRFLFVLDDVWSEDHYLWERFKHVFLKCGQIGSKIIVTTRSKKVASIVGTVEPYFLKALSNDDCWTLFKQRAFGLGGIQHPNFEVIGKDIVKRCGGLPLAAKALGSMMHFKSEESQWLSIKESEIWNLPAIENTIFPALRLSYNHLSLHLKQCFAYCAIFPKGYEIEKDMLISLWMANGFIPSISNMTLEDVADDILNELLLRLFFQDVQRNIEGKIVKLKMHDLMHDLALVIMRNECSVIQADKNDAVGEGIRHISCDVRPLVKIPSGVDKAQALRTFLLLSHRAMNISSRVDHHTINFRFLRVLGLSHSSIQELPVPTKNLKLLRYLDLSYTYIKTLPESVVDLQNLQTLLLKSCESLLRLPKRMSKMMSLRHLDINGCKLLTHMPAEIGKLTSLQRLSDFIVGEEGSHIGELCGLNLRGELHIKQLENLGDEVDALQAKLISKTNLQSLGFSWKNDYGANVEHEHHKVLDALQPTWNLKIFYLKNYKGTSFPSWMKSSSYSKLFKISIVGCRCVNQLPKFGRLPLVKILFVEGMDCLKQIGDEIYADKEVSGVLFPSLEKLTLKDLPNLEELYGMDGRELYPCLSKLIIMDCPKLNSIPSVPSLKHLVLRNSNEVLLRFVADMTSLSSLHVGGFPSMVCFPRDFLCKLSQLQSFKIQDCPRLFSLPETLQENHYLRTHGTVVIWNCGDMVSAAECSIFEHSTFEYVPDF